MLQDSIVLEKRHRRFITTVCESETIYALKSRKGFATSSSTKFEDDRGNPIGIICFWAEKVRAKSCIKNEWRKYKIQEIQLSEFIENWCVGMENDGLIVGTAFDQNMFGYEAEPLELILELIKQLKTIGKEINLKKFDKLSDLETQVQKILS